MNLKEQVLYIMSTTSQDEPVCSLEESCKLEETQIQTIEEEPPVLTKEEIQYNANIKAFEKILEFVKTLTDVFGNKPEFHSLKLYNRILELTAKNKKAAIEKHCLLFSEFCSKNKLSILARSASQLDQSMITWSLKVRINMQLILNKSNNQQKQIIWQYLSIIGTMLNPEDKKDFIKFLQKQQMEPSVKPQGEKKTIKEGLEGLFGSDSKEGQFMGDLFKKVSSQIDLDKMQSDPMSGIMSLMANPSLLSDLTKTITEGANGGKLGKPKKMLQSFVKMVSELDLGDDESDEETPEAVQALDTIPEGDEEVKE